MAAILSGRYGVLAMQGQPVCQSRRYVLESRRDLFETAGLLPNTFEEYQ